MKTLYVKKIATIFSLMLLCITSVLHASSDTTAQCQKSKKEYTKIETQWSDLYTEESFLHDELSRLQSISRDVKIIIDVLDMASRLLEEDVKLSKTETATLSVRIPKDRGILYSDGSFAITDHEAKSLKESMKILDTIATWANTGIIQIQGNIAYIHPQISQLHKKVNRLEAIITKTCTDKMALATLEEEYTRANDQTIIDRFTHREQLRYEEVSNRRWGDIERTWVNKYYNTCRFHPCSPDMDEMR